MKYTGIYLNSKREPMFAVEYADMFVSKAEYKTVLIISGPLRGQVTKVYHDELVEIGCFDEPTEQRCYVCNPQYPEDISYKHRPGCPNDC